VGILGVSSSVVVNVLVVLCGCDAVDDVVKPFVVYCDEEMAEDFGATVPQGSESLLV